MDDAFSYRTNLTVDSKLGKGSVINEKLGRPSLLFKQHITRFQLLKPFILIDTVFSLYLVPQGMQDYDGPC